MTAPLRLSAEEQAILAGEQGPGPRKAMEIVVALGQIYGASDLVPIASAQVSGVSYKNLGEAGLAFLQEWAAQGARARVPATLNPAGMDRLAWRELGIPEQFALQQEAIIAAYIALGVTPTCTCTPHLAGHLPRRGQHLAWAESSAVSYANSVIGARSNREGGPSALAAAIVGRTARYGLHLDQNRRPNVGVEVRCPVRTEADSGALGILVGQQVRNGVPYFRFRQRELPSGALSALGAALAASGAVALFHVEGTTPEALSGEVTAPQARPLVIDDLAEAYRSLNGSDKEIELVSLGCPHASLDDIRAIARYLDGRRVKAELWITTARAVRDAAAQAGLLAQIEAAGGRVVADTCMVVAPAAALGFRTLATNSAKMAFYAPTYSGLSVRFGPMEQCLEAAISGRWQGSSPPPGGPVTARVKPDAPGRARQRAHAAGEASHDRV